MSRPRIYVETTIPSYLTARRSETLRIAADQMTTEIWWETERHLYELHTSQEVVNEVSRGDNSKAAARLEVLKGLPRLQVMDAVGSITKALLQQSIVPLNAAADAVHIGFSAAHSMDFLLTWNCKHINNPRLIRRIERVCADFGLTCPVICTPEELLLG